MRSHTQTRQCCISLGDPRLDMDNVVDGIIFPLAGERVRTSSFVRYIFCLTFYYVGLRLFIVLLLGRNA